MTDQCLIIAEIGVNHNGSVDMACSLIDAAAEAGASMVKFQSFRSAELVSASAAKADYQQQSTDAWESQLDMLRKYELSEEDHRRILEHAGSRKIEFLSTPFDLPSLELLVGRLGLSRIKIPSGEITNAPLLLHAARLQCEVILSTGASTLAEVEQALGVLAFGYIRTELPHTAAQFAEAFSSPDGQEALRRKVTLLHCTSEYPAPFADVNLRAMDTMAAKFGLPVGLSDHTMGICVAIAAVARGANVVEKHITLDRTLPGPDHRASLEPGELTEMVRAIRNVESALGNGEKTASLSETKNIPVIRKSLTISQPITRGERISEQHLTAKRPGTGISPIFYWDYLGVPAAQDYMPDDPLRQ